MDKDTSLENTSKEDRHFPNRSKFLAKWLRYSKYNQFFEEVDIIPFKTPLKKEFDRHLSHNERFTFRDVYNFSVSQDKPITDVIDLTDTGKYYSARREEFYPSSVTHHKFQIPGKTVPKKESLERILDKMEALINEKKVIGVHCLHGANRTGFVICMFLKERLGWDPAEAIVAFKKARGAEISHLEYLEALLGLDEDEDGSESEIVEKNDGEEGEDKE